MRSNSKNKPQMERSFNNKPNLSRTKTPKVIQHSKIESIPTPIKLKWDNELELYQKNQELHQWIEHEAIKYNHILNLFKGLNTAISDVIIKKKIKIYEIDRKIQSDKDKKEKEAFEFKKTIEETVDSALMKANQTLENIKLLSKSKQSQPLPFLVSANNKEQQLHMQQKNSSSSKNQSSSTIIESKHKEIDVLVKRCQDKYLNVLQFNESNMKSYFVPLMKIKSLFKESKVKLRRSKQKSKQLSNIFKMVYTNNKSKPSHMDIDKENDDIDDCYTRFNGNVNIVIRLSSILSSELFKKLYLKVYYRKDNSKQVNEEESIYNAFSLWYMLNHLNDIFKTNSNNDSSSSQPLFSNSSLLKVFNEKNALSSYFDYSSQKVIDHFILKHLTKYTDHLNKKSNDDDTGIINENAIFTNDFYKCYQRLISIEKIRLAKYIKRNHNSIFDKGNIAQVELNYFKNIQCVYANNGSYCCNICISK